MTPDDLEQLADAVDEAMAPVAVEVWREGVSAALAELAVEDLFALPAPPMPDEIIERMRANGLEDPDTT